MNCNCCKTFSKYNVVTISDPLDAITARFYDAIISALWSHYHYKMLFIHDEHYEICILFFNVTFRKDHVTTQYILSDYL